LLSKLLGTNIALGGLGTGIKGFAAVAQAVLDTITRLTFGVKLADLSISTIVRGSLARLLTTISALRVAFVALIAPLAPFILKAAALGAVAFVLVKAFQTLEDNTAVFSKSFAIIIKQFEVVSPFFESLKDAFSEFTAIIVTAGFQAFGILVAGLAKVVSLGLSLAKVFPFKKFFSPESLADLESVKTQLDSFTEQLFASNFDIRKLGSATLASVADNNKKVADVNIETLRQIQKDASTFLSNGLADVQNTYKTRLETINNALQAELITVDEYNRLLLFTERAYAEERKKILDEIREKNLVSNQELTLSLTNLVTAFREQAERLKVTFGEVARAAFDIFARGISNAFVQVGKNLASGKSLFKGFGEALLSTFGDIAKMIGEFYIKLGIARIAASWGAEGWQVLAAGVALSIFGGVLGASVGGAGAAFSRADPRSPHVRSPATPWRWARS
jgi:hypothetical protein